MGNYSKSKLKLKRWIKVLIIILALVLALSIGLLVFMLVNNNIVIEKVDYSAKDATEDMAKNSTPIIVNNVIVGALYNNKWVSSEKYYMINQSREDIDIDIYSKNGKAGTFKTKNVAKENTSTSIYAYTTSPNFYDEFLAIAKNDKDIMPLAARKILNVTEEDISNVKDALGIYKVFNSSVKINEVYEISLSTGNNIKLICVTNEPGNSKDAYSAIIYGDNTGKYRLIKYNYIRNSKEAANWPIYSFKFAADLNQDGINELIIQETKEFEVKYDILELRKNDFVEVLSSTMKVNN